MRKRYAINSLVIFVALAVAGCGVSNGGGDAPAAATEQPAEATTVPEPAEEPGGVRAVARMVDTGANSAANWVLAEGVWTSYMAADGLPSERIHDIEIDNEGYLWVATDRVGGRFDGATWESAVPVFVSVMDISIDGQGRAWMADGRGVDVFDGGSLTTHDYETGLSSVFTEAILVDSHGRTWVGIITGDTDSGCVGGEGNGGLNLYEDGEWSWVGTAELFGSSVMALAEDNDGNIWAAGTGGVAKFDGEEWVAIEMPEELEASSVVINSLAPDQDGNIWVGMTGLGLWRWDGTEWTNYTSENGLASDTVWTLAVDGYGRVWAGTGSGLSVLEDQGWTTFTTQDGLAHNDVRALAIADDGVWIGTWRGLSHVYFGDGS